MIKNIKFSNILFFIIIIVSISILKNICVGFIESENYINFAQQVLIFWSESQFINLIWLLPIMLNVYVIAKKYYFEMMNFDTRYSNRRKFIDKLIIECCLSTIIYTIIIAFIQIIILSVSTKIVVIFSIELVIIFIQYIVENILLNLIIILFALYIKNFMYAYIIIFIIIIISLTSIINLGFIISHQYMPFINMYVSNKVNVVSILISILIVFTIKKIYLKTDILGGND